MVGLRQGLSRRGPFLAIALAARALRVASAQVYAHSGQKYDLASGVALLKQLKRLAHTP